MTTKWVEELRAAGADPQGAMKRFGGNAALYQKFLLRFPQDDTFEKIGRGVEEQDWAAVLAAAHTLKGVAGNLGLTPLFDACSTTVLLVREQDYEGAVRSYGGLKRAYEDLTAILTEAE